MALSHLMATKEQSKAYREANLDKARMASAKWCKANPGRVFKASLKSDFGITVLQYLEMHAKQNGRCAICKDYETAKKKNGEAKKLGVDHNHVTGQIRGLLCAHCNQSIGKMGESPERLRAAADYIELHSLGSIH